MVVDIFGTQHDKLGQMQPTNTHKKQTIDEIGFHFQTKKLTRIFVQKYVNYTISSEQKMKKKLKIINDVKVKEKGNNTLKSNQKNQKI